MNLRLLFSPTLATNRLMLRLLGVVILVSGLVRRLFHLAGSRSP